MPESPLRVGDLTINFETKLSGYNRCQAILSGVRIGAETVVGFPLAEGPSIFPQEQSQNVRDDYSDSTASRHATISVMPLCLQSLSFEAQR